MRVAGAVAPAPHLGEQLLAAEHGAGRAASSASRSNSVGVRWPRRPSAPHPPRAPGRSPARRRRRRRRRARGALDAAQQRPHAGDELAQRERLGHVVVGADAEPDQQVGLLAARGQHQHRHRAGRAGPGGRPRARRAGAASGRAAEPATPVPNTPNPRRNPLVDLLRARADVVAGVDAVLLTHLHQDHFDATARAAAARTAAVSPAARRRAPARGRLHRRAAGVRGRQARRRADRAHRRPARTGEIGERDGAVSGFVLHAPGEPSVYIAGDTILCDEVRAAARRAPSGGDRGQRERARASTRATRS